MHLLNITTLSTSTMILCVKTDPIYVEVRHGGFSGLLGTAGDIVSLIRMVKYPILLCYMGLFVFFCVVHVIINN